MSPTLAARRARVARIRRTITVAAVAVFIALFATIYIQMAAGKDPALRTSATAQITPTSSSSEEETETSSEETTTSSPDDSSEVMTTAQS